MKTDSRSGTSLADRACTNLLWIQSARVNVSVYVSGSANASASGNESTKVSGCVLFARARVEAMGSESVSVSERGSVDSSANGNVNANLQ